MEIPIIDLFAGPGGLGEGFSALFDNQTQKRKFKIVLSIEKDPHAHQTLTLRSFFRQFEPKEVPADYYEFISGNISLEELYKRWPNQAKKANKEAWLAELGEGKNAVPNEIVDEKIKNALKKNKDWLLIGGPPCQAYSVMGRSRRRETILDEQKDERVSLYKQYLRILAIHNPAVFVMENVKGLLSAKTQASRIFSKILEDLANPSSAYLSEYGKNGIKINCPGYRIYSLVVKAKNIDLNGNPIFKQEDFIICCENYGVPQTRHRIILLGIRKDTEFIPSILEKQLHVPLAKILFGLPKLRSGISKSNNYGEMWKEALEKFIEQNFFININNNDLKLEIIKQISQIRIPRKGSGKDFISYSKTRIIYKPEWYIDPRINGVCNHVSKAHMQTDLWRYFYASCYAIIFNKSPKLEDFPPDLLPLHKNVQEGIDSRKFPDRFRVQLWGEPCKTITSHISKDGHYYIHPDPTQCRSFTVREAARVQTFPDNYYFCGTRTSQFTQVGNAVPPLIANQIARIIVKVFSEAQFSTSFFKNKFIKS